LAGHIPAIVADAVVLGDVEVVVEERLQDSVLPVDPRVLESLQIEEMVMGVNESDRSVKTPSGRHLQ
jgi:hypothetical protein